MAHDERGRGGRRERDGRGPEWRGDEGFGGGWGNQVPRPQRLGDRASRGMSDDPDHGPATARAPATAMGAAGTGPTRRTAIIVMAGRASIRNLPAPASTGRTSAA